MRKHLTAGAGAAVLLLAALSGCGDDSKAATAAPASASSSPTPSFAPITPGPTDPTPSPTAPDAGIDRSIGMSCLGEGGDDGTTTEATFSYKVGAKPDFHAYWGDHLTNCSISSVDLSASDTVTPSTPLELAAYKASHYDDDDMGTLYTICAENDPDDIVAGDGFAMSDEQVAEMTGAMMLCPTHPLARKWHANMKAGQADAKLEASGRLIEDGTYRVGKEIKAGTYYSNEGIDGCYWERQDSSGHTIANDFVDSAKRVQVTIRKSDYGFETRGCGTWRPVS